MGTSTPSHVADPSVSTHCTAVNLRTASPLVEVVGFGGGVEDGVYTEHFVGTNVIPLRSSVLGAVHNVGLRCAHVGKFARCAHASCMLDKHACMHAWGVPSVIREAVGMRVNRTVRL